MAEEQPKGNIRQEYNNATIGLNLDQTLNQIKPGTLTYALNAALENFDSSSVNYQNEQGNELCVTFPKGYILIGTHFINEQNKHIFYITNPDTNDSQIGYMDNNDCIYNTLVDAVCLNFSINHPIHKTVHKITNCTTEIYWTDGINPRRYLDINNIPKLLQTGSTLCDPIYSDEVDCNQLKLQPNFSIPQIAVTDITTGGELVTGTYQFAAQYSDAAGNPYTSYYSVTNPTPIADPFITTVNYNYTVGKSIVLNMTGLDTTGQYQYFNLAVIKTINGITSVELVGTYFIEEANDRITYTGQNKTQIRLTINDIFEKFPYYDIAQDITSVQDVLVWDNLTSIDRINYQEIASGINLLWETYRIPATENYADELNATNLRGYLRDEVYAFEIVFLLKNGKQTDGFHIPGREQNYNEFSQPNIPDTSADFIGEPEPGTNYSPYWKIYNTASVLGTAPEYSPDPTYKGSYQYGEFAYWESTDEYPCNVDVWGDLAGLPIRHHKFPDILVSPAYESKIFTGPSTMVMGNDAVFPIGVRVNNADIRNLITTSSLTAEQKDDIIGYKIVRGDRGTNKSIIAKGILRNVGTYEREGQSYYYPNYPYNDLEEDPFLNEVNNAWTKLCEPWDINVFEFNMPETGTPTYVEFEITSCNTNKRSKIKITELGKTVQCSITRPLPLGPGQFNKMNTNRGGFETPAAGIVANVSPSNYDVWFVTVGETDIGTGKAGYEVGWQDTVMGLSKEWVPGNIIASNAGSYYLNCIKGLPPVNNSGNDNEEFRLHQEIRVDACKVEVPQKAIVNSHRQIFNSPETSFGQPFLGGILKLENVMFGGGKGHFVQVKSNAKYKLLTKEAQEDALKSSQNVADMSVGFNVTAMFTVYQAYLTIYVNGITRRNYAQSFNSIADYNYSEAIPNNQGVKQRNLDIKRYLIPGVQSVGDTFPINNYRRESSVYLKTDDAKPVLPFPSNSPNMIVAGNPKVTDYSRFTIGDTSSCSSPVTEQDLRVVSYYASLKNQFVNQWGQMYSYETIDTGFQTDIYSSGTSIVFGGDTFISRFAFKTKLPFFIDNRVNAPDDSDIFYDEIGNIAYPKYWHSARSILEDYVVQSGGTGTLTNIISYKAHKFDCPNNQLPGPPDNNPNRTFYDGYFYLFAYGVPNFYCESSYNTDLRQAFNNREGDFWPHVSTSIPDDWVQEEFVSIANDNTYTYNVTFSKQNKENTFTHLPPDWTTQLCYTYYPFRAIYSDSQNIDSDNKVNSWLTYRALSYFDFPQNFGDLTSLDGIQNRAILARFENKSLMYNNLLTIDTSNPQAAYVGNPALFKGAPPIDFAETDLGYVGSQNKFLLKIPQGQITVDAKRGQVFLISGTESVDLSAFGSGMNRFFTDHLAFEILRYYPNVDTDNNFTGIGLHGVYDSKFDRVIISKLDYIPLDPNIKYDDVLRQFYIEETINEFVFRTQVYLTDPDYFCNKSWTLSYNVNTKSWISFHSYIPNFYIAENNFFYSGINGCCEDFDLVAGEIVPTPSTTTTTSSSTSSTTTTTTTEAPLDCTLAGTVVLTNCTLVGTAVITVPPVPPPCTRPTTITTFELITGYNTLVPPSTVNSTGSQIDACAAIAYVTSSPDFVYTFIIGQAFSLSLLQTVYIGTGTDCTVMPDGWYFTDQSANTTTNVYHIVSGVITEIVQCVPTSTTTTTSTTICTGSHLYNYNLIFSTTTIGDFTSSFTNACLAAACLNIVTCGPSSLLIGWWDNLSPVIGNTVYNATTGCVTPNVDGYYVIYLTGIYQVVEMLDGVIVDFPSC
jgi:hypothetical protein